MLALATMQARPTANIGWVDYLVIGIYFVATIGIGLVLRTRMRTSEDFFLSGRSLPSWVTGLAFVGANLGALEILGMGANAAQYGILQAHFYWIGAIPAMIFVAIFMMPFYYGSKTHSVPGFLKLRYNEATRGFNAASFAVLTLLTSGINMYAAALVFNVLLGWSLPACIWLSALFIMVYIILGGLTSSIYNETLQFFLIVAGLLPLSIIGLINVGGWSGLQAKVNNPAFFHLWAGTAGNNNPFGVNFIGIILGLGFVLSFGYWCTDFLVVQRALASEDMAAAQRTPLIATFPKLFFPILAIAPGLIILSVLPNLGHGGGFQNSYNMAIPFAMVHYFPSGLLGLGLTALLASFMSGMAGNVTAFNTVWTYDIYQAHIRPGASDAHYLQMGRIATVAGIALSILAAYMATRFNNIMDMLQLIFAFVNAPLFATFLLGMFWKRTTGHGAFFGLLGGTAAAAIHHGLTLPEGSIPGIKGGWMAVVHNYPSEMAQNFWTAIFAWTTCFVLTIVISLVTKAPDESKLTGLVYSLTERPQEGHLKLFQRPIYLGAGILEATVLLNVIFR